MLPLFIHFLQLFIINEFDFLNSYPYEDDEGDDEEEEEEEAPKGPYSRKIRSYR